MEFFLFAGLMSIDMLLFMILAARYTYVEASPEKEQGQDEKLKLPVEQRRDGVADSSTGKFAVENKGFTDSAM